MNIFTYNNAWLKYRVLNKIQTDHKGLFVSKVQIFKNTFRNLFTHKNCWILVLLSVIVCFAIAPFVQVSFFNFLTLNFDSAKIIVDQRASNIATIISISLVVVGFLINNLAVKSPITYKLLFKRSLLYFTIYLTLSTIGCFIMASLLRDTLGEFAFTRIVITGCYLALAILFLIGYLFRKIIHFTNEKMIAGMLKEELLAEGQRKMKAILIKQYSGKLYPTLFKNFATQEFQITLENLLGSNIEFTEVDDVETVEIRILKDVNILVLQFYLWLKSKSTKDIFFTRLVLDEHIEKGKEIIWSNEKPNNKFYKWLLRNSVLTAKVTNAIDTDMYRKEFDQKIIRLAEESKYQNLEITLEAYIELYDLQITNQ